MCSLFIHSVSLCNDSDAQSDLGLLSPHMPEDTFSHGANHVIFLLPLFFVCLFFYRWRFVLYCHFISFWSCWLLLSTDANIIASTARDARSASRTKWALRERIWSRKSNIQRYILSAEIALTNQFFFQFSSRKLSPEVDRTGADLILISGTKWQDECQ